MPTNRPTERAGNKVERGDLLEACTGRKLCPPLPITASEKMTGRMPSVAEKKVVGRARVAQMGLPVAGGVIADTR